MQHRRHDAGSLAFACSRLIEEGALDAYTIPGTMKKGRPGHVLTVLCPPEKEEEMARCVLAETTTNGLRARRCTKYFLQPGVKTVETRWGQVRVKTAEGRGILHQKPEYEDVAAWQGNTRYPMRRCAGKRCETAGKNKGKERGKTT